MVTVGFVTHTLRPAALKLQEEATDWLHDQGHKVRTLASEQPNPFPATDLSALDGVDLAVSLGGDGTMLRTVDLVAPREIPVLGVNLGRLGYLTTVEPEHLCAALGRYLRGDYSVEPRMMLEVTLRDTASGAERLHRSALNDVVLTRPAGGHTVHTAMTLAGAPFLSFAADSMIVATPTGSTAYNLSARGPIASPRTRVVIVTPVAPHMLFDRSLVLDAEEEIGFEVPDGQAAELVVDGWPAGAFQPGEVLSCRAGRRDALFVTFGDRDFHQLLKHKFNLADR